MISYRNLTLEQYVDALFNFLKVEGIEGFRASVYLDDKSINTIGVGYTFRRNNNTALWQAANITLTPAQLSLLQQIDNAPNNQKNSLAAGFNRVLSVNNNRGHKIIENNRGHRK